jgi:phytoene dehydrogenase-like protein
VLVDNGDPRVTARAFEALTGSAEAHRAWERFYDRMGTLARAVFPTVLEPLRTADELARRVGDDELWRAVTQRPLGELLEETFADDTLRGIVATDALIGTFADLRGEDLRQNVCFLYHLIGGGTGDWDVPWVAWVRSRRPSPRPPPRPVPTSAQTPASSA